MPIEIFVHKAALEITRGEPVLERSIRANDVVFRFDDCAEAWKDVAAVALFKTRLGVWSVLLDADRRCKIPWEAIAEGSAGSDFHIGLYGAKNDNHDIVVLSTVWIKAPFRVLPGLDTEADPAADPTPNQYQQMLAMASGFVERVGELDETKRFVEENANRAEDEANRADQAAQRAEVAGNKGIYVGSGEMPEDCHVQIDPEGCPIEAEDIMGGYYKPEVVQTAEDAVSISFVRSDEAMPEVPEFQLSLMPGPVGPQGERGPIGVTGAQGERGPIGERGPQGEQGPIGVTGPQGERGVQGPQGEQGVQGPPGPKGEQGPQGEQGIRGEKGVQGPQGIQGPRGEQGPAGPQGAQGIRGEKGDTGKSGVYVGSGEMPDDCDVQIDPDGDVFDLNELTAELVAALPIYKGEVEPV